ncbi:IEC3 subunit of the Ino80 complex, chromatin re-modelling-domain-containing protein [Dipodascopsis tothii]|uniref:IEC3 subunit of the Ino80 complex, chromatin re-modelling-domain-containing protein n=1 Tax=Dipodascopsis tothii TaxID=44089 RepID=UPI0034CDC99E
MEPMADRPIDSFYSAAGPAAGGREDGEAAKGARVPYKSFRKKYRKMMVRFDKVMKESDELFRRDQLARRAIRRLAEENSRLLDMLYDVTASGHLDPSLAVAYLAPDDEGAPPTPTAVGEPRPPPGLTLVQRDQADYESAVHAGIDRFQYRRGATPPYLREDEQDFFLDFDAEDAATGALPAVDDRRDQPPERNPMGVLAWLRRHQPNVFLQELEDQKKAVAVDRPATKKKKLNGASPAATPTARKRKNAADHDDGDKRLKK